MDNSDVNKEQNVKKRRTILRISYTFYEPVSFIFIGRNSRVK